MKLKNSLNLIFDKIEYNKIISKMIKEIHKSPNLECINTHFVSNAIK